MASSSLKKILKSLSSNKNVQGVVSTLNGFADELKAKETEIKSKFDKEKVAAVKAALEKYGDVVKTLNTSEANLEKEVKKALTKLKNSADKLEKNIQKYRKKAQAKSSQLEKNLKKTLIGKKATKKAAKVTKKATTKKSATKKTTTKKAAAKKATTTKKSTSKKAATTKKSV